MKDVSSIERIPPQNIEAEQSVLGSMLQDKEAIIRVVEFLKEEYFYKESHKIIYSNTVELFEKGEPVDLITIVEQLRKKNLLEEVGGISYISTLIDIVPTSANVEYYARIVEEKAILRNLINVGTEIVRFIYDNEEEQIDEILDKAERMVFGISQRGIHHYFYHSKDIVMNVFDIIDKKYREKGIIGLSTGFPDLDRITSGLQSSDLIIIAGRTSMGKTSLGLNIAENVALKEKKPVAIFSLEMSREQVISRLMCSVGNVDAHRLRTGFLEEDDWRRLGRAASLLSDAPIYIDDTSNITAIEVRGKARRLKSQVSDLSLILIDYLQLMQGRKSESRVQEISEISRSLKSLARELNIPVVALSQLSRAVEKRESKRPQLSDLRESGSIEQDADVVAFIHREEYYKSMKEGTPFDEERPPQEKAEIIIAKQRNGPAGVSIEVGFLRNYTKFVSIEKHREKELEV